MPARIVVVFDDRQFADQASAALRDAGLDNVAFIDPTAALTALENAKSIELLITKTAFPAGVQNGISLALTTKLRRPDVKVLFVGSLDHRDHANGVGDGYLTLPVSVAEIAEAARSLLAKP